MNGDSGRVVSTLMNTLRDDTSVGYDERLYDMDRPNVALRTTSIATKYMVAPPLRKSTLGLRLARMSYVIGLERVFGGTAPGRPGVPRCAERTM